MFNSAWRWLIGLAILLLLVVILPPTRQTVLGLADIANPNNWFGESQTGESFIPIDATTLAGHDGLYYQDSRHLIGTINTARYSAYQDLIDEAKINPDATIYTDKNLPTPTPVVIPTLPAFISSVEAGLGLVGGGTSGKVSLAVKPGSGIVLTDGAVTATLGDTIDLSSDEVVSVLPVAKGGTGLSMAPLSGTILVGTGTGYTQALLSAGDGMTLISGSHDLSYALDNTVCRTTGNCSSLGIIGNGTTNYLAKFTGSGAIGNSLIFDDGGKVGIGTSSPGAGLDVANGLANGSLRIGADVNASTMTTNTRKIGRIVSPSYAGSGGGNNIFLIGMDSLSGENNLNIGGGAGFTPYAATRIDFYTGANAATNGGSLAMQINSVQNVGIGLSPATTQKLHVRQATNQFRIDVDASNALSFSVNSVGFTTLSATGSSPGMNLAGGNIGLGTATPQNKLDVSGGVAIGSFAGVNAAPSNSLIVSGNVGIGITNPGASKLDVQGPVRFGQQSVTNADTTIANALTVVNGTSGQTASTLTSSTAAGGVSLYFNNTGTGGNSWRMFVGGNNVSAQGGAGINEGNFILRNETDGSVTRLVVQKATGNVAIGNLIPQSKLDVAGGIAIGSYAGVNAAPSNGLIVSGNVGIGKNSAGVALDVSGSIATSAHLLVNGGVSPGGTGLTFNYTSSQPNGGPAVRWSDGTAANTLGLFVNSGMNYQGNSANPNFYVRESTADGTLGTIRFMIGGTSGTDSYFNGRNVAIGNTSPQARLHVSRGATGGAPSLTDNAGNVLLISTTTTPELAFGGYGTTPFAMWMQVKRTLNDGNSYPLAIQPLGGNIGIGLASNIDAKLTFVADTTAAGGILFGTDTNLYRSAAGTLKTDGLFVAGGGVTIGSGGTQISKHLSATTTWDPTFTASGASTGTTVTVTGAALGDTIAVGFTQAVPQGASLTGSVTSSNTVTITLINLTGSPLDLTSGTVRADVWQH